MVVYKVDRLTRSLADFAKMVEVFDAHGVSFVAVTQQFNTTTSMGRLTLNVLLSFAQFEREVTGERIRDKIAASKRRECGWAVCLHLATTSRDRRIVIDEREAETVRYIFRRYQSSAAFGCSKKIWTAAVSLSKRRSSKAGIESGGHSFSRGALYALLSNPIYVGELAQESPPSRSASSDRGSSGVGANPTAASGAPHSLKMPRCKRRKFPLIERLVDDWRWTYAQSRTKGEEIPLLRVAQLPSSRYLFWCVGWRFACAKNSKVELRPLPGNARRPSFSSRGRSKTDITPGHGEPNVRLHAARTSSPTSIGSRTDRRDCRAGR